MVITYSIPEDLFSQELWISSVPGATGLLRPQTLPGGYLKLNPRFNSPLTIAKRCKSIVQPQRDCILEWARLNLEKISSFLDATDPKWQISFRGVYDSLRLLYLRLFNEEARTVELMELQLKHRVEILLAEERLCLERHEKELAMRSNCLRSSAPRRVKRKPTKKRRMRSAHPGHDRGRKALVGRVSARIC